MTARARSRRTERWAAVGRLSASVGHETSNLLAGILGQSELGLLSGDAGRMKSALDVIVQIARELKVMMDRLQSMRKLIESPPQSTNQLEILRTLLGLLERPFQKAGIKLERRYGSVPMSFSDPGAIVPALFYGLQVSLDALRKASGGTLTLVVEPQADQLMFRLDLAPPDGSALETPAPDPADEGFAEAAGQAGVDGGSLEVEPTPKGWALVCRFPLRTAPRAEVTNAAVAPIGAWHETKRELAILVVEDEAPVRELLQEILEGAGCKVRAEGEAAGALRAFGQARYDAVFTDLLMPGMDGLALLRGLRKIDPNALVIVVTGRMADDTIEAALAAGATTVLHKPFEVSEIRGIVAGLRSAPARSEAREGSTPSTACGHLER